MFNLFIFVLEKGDCENYDIKKRGGKEENVNKREGKEEKR